MMRPIVRDGRFVISLCATVLMNVAAPGGQPALRDRIIDVDGTSIFLRCGGERRPGSPVVVLEAGGFNSADTWRDVHVPIATVTRACAHDRPGRGRSGSAREGLTAAAYIALLRQTLRSAAEPPPYVLVGHSLGGLIVQLYAASHPAEVAGIVLVDSSHQDQSARMAAFRPPAPSAGPSPEAVPLQQFADDLARNRWELRAPLIVLSRGRWSDGNVQDADARLKVWIELQRDLANRSERSEHIIARRSGHYIQNDEPSLVIDAVRRLVAP